MVGLQGTIVSPLMARGNNIGLLILWGDGIGEVDVPAVAGFANQLAVAVDNAVLFSAIRQQRERLRSMAARLAEAEEADRRLVVRDLHDQVGQNLSALNLALSALREEARALPSEAATLFRRRIDDALARRLVEYVRAGGTLVVNARQAGSALPSALTGAVLTGEVRTAAEAVCHLDGSTMRSAEFDYAVAELRGARPVVTVPESNAVLVSDHRVGGGHLAVSYTHLTLPTIYSV